MPTILTKQYVSNMGRYTTAFGKKSFGSRNSGGYMTCKITKQSTGRSKVVMLHRVVCVAFHGTPLDGMEVDHNNGDKSDARASNLEWVTHSENVQRAFENDERGSSAQSLGKPILQCGGYEFKEVQDDVEPDSSEEWREVNGMDGYFVSNKGRFRFPDNRVTMGSKRQEGYYVVQVNAKKHVMKDLVAETFVDSIGPRPTPSHHLSFKDFTKRDCAAVYNLCWRTNSEKIAASHAQGRKNAADKERKRVFSRNINGNAWVLHTSQGECAAAVGISAGTLSEALKNNKPSKGFEFTYEPEEDLDGEEWVEIKEEWMDYFIA